VARTRHDHDAVEFPSVLAAASAGAPAACDHLFGWLADPVAGYLRARGADDPEDLANEVFLRVFRTLPTFRGGRDRFRAWVFTIARNCLIDERRRAARRPAVVLFEPGPDLIEGPDAESLALARLAEERVAALLAQLSPDQHDVLMLRIVADLSVEQTASVLGKTTEAVKALTRRGLAALEREIHRSGVSL
jgi:RNA polymerase sigma-70 factor (ECF subfamily)